MEKKDKISELQTTVGVGENLSLFIVIYVKYNNEMLVGRSRDRFPVVSLGIFSVVPSDKTMYPGVDSDPENEYQGFLLG